MGNFVTLCTAGSSTTKPEKVLQVMKINDGKILEFRAQMRVKDLLINYPNSYVGMFKEATQPLPLDYKLKIGKLYYLLPCCLDSGSSPNDGAKRIKVVITKEQLKTLLSNQASLDDFVKKSCKMVSLVQKSSSLKKLESIPEESESVY